jgi:hypothetical protein
VRANVNRGILMAQKENVQKLVPKDLIIKMQRLQRSSISTVTVIPSEVVETLVNSPEFTDAVISKITHKMNTMMELYGLKRIDYPVSLCIIAFSTAITFVAFLANPALCILGIPAVLWGVYYAREVRKRIREKEG